MVIAISRGGIANTA